MHKYGDFARYLDARRTNRLSNAFKHIVENRLRNKIDEIIKQEFINFLNIEIKTLLKLDYKINFAKIIIRHYAKKWTNF